jgi:hypothetical protein
MGKPKCNRDLDSSGGGQMGDAASMAVKLGLCSFNRGCSPRKVREREETSRQQGQNF